MAEHLDAHRGSRRAADVLLFDGAVDMGHLPQVELAGEDNDVGKLGIELQGLNVGDVELRGEMDFLTDLAAIDEDGDVGGDDGGDAGIVGGVADAVHEFDVFVVDDGVDRQITLDTVFATHGGDFSQVVNGETIGRMCPHIEGFDAEIDGVGASF